MTHRKWDFDPKEEHNSLYNAWRNECQRTDTLAWECNRLEADREYNAKLVRERDARIAELEAATIPVPVPDIKTLEDLAKIGRALWGYTINSWGDLPTETKNKYLDQTAAILRAARPVLDVTGEQFKEKWLELGCRQDTSAYEDNSDLLAWINTRIRYRVEPTPADCPTCAKVRAALEGER